MKSDEFYKQNTLPDLQEGDLKQVLPREIGPYKIDSLLNKGGMSLLYLGVHPESNQPIAIKVLSPKYLKNKEIKALFLKEAEIIKMANHPNIVRLYGHGDWEKGLYIAMEFIQGVSLRQFIQHKSLTLKRALEIVLQVAYALCHLHTHGVIHRDLKPENILITETGEIKVIDFGIAQLRGEETEGQKKKLMGTPVYMSPEQKQNPHKLTNGSDIYALGIIAYELVLGRLSHGAIHLSLLPKPLAAIIGKALKADPKERYHDIVELITDISQYIKTIDEEKREDTPHEFVQMMERVGALLLPKTKPRWNQLEIGMAVHEGESFNGLYLDFFHMPDNRYCIVLAEPKEVKGSAFIHALSFRGALRMAVHKDHHPVKMIQGLNRVLYEDPMKQTFAACFLFLNPEKEQLEFVSCGFSNLWHLPEGSKKMKILSTPNPILGSDKEAVFLETVDNWQFGDTLVLHSLPANSLNETTDYELLSAQHQADKILQKSHPHKTSAVLTIHRMF